MKAWKVLAINSAVCGISFAVTAIFTGLPGLVGWIVGLSTAGFAVGVALLK